MPLKECSGCGSSFRDHKKVRVCSCGVGMCSYCGYDSRSVVPFEIYWKNHICVYCAREVEKKVKNILREYNNRR